VEIDKLSINLVLPIKLKITTPNLFYLFMRRMLFTKSAIF